MPGGHLDGRRNRDWEAVIAPHTVNCNSNHDK